MVSRKKRMDGSHSPGERAFRKKASARDDIREEWLVIEWPEDEDEPKKYWLSTLDTDIAFVDLVGTIKLRWRIRLGQKRHLRYSERQLSHLTSSRRWTSAVPVGLFCGKCSSRPISLYLTGSISSCQWE